MSNGTAVGKRLGVAPVLARRMPAAGRNGKRLVTGDAANVRAIVGKGAVADAMSRLVKPGKLAARRAAKRPTNFSYGTSSFTASDLSLPRSHPYVPGDSIRGKMPTKAPNPGPRSFETPGETAERIHYKSSRLQGFVNKAAAGTNGMGQLVPQFRGASLKSLTPQAPSFAPKQPKAGNTLVAAGGTKPSGPSTAGLSGVSGTTGSSAGTTGAAGGVGKRSYDPEDERRHRQGALAATAGLGGADLVYSGGKEIRRDSKLQRGAPAVLHPGSPPQRGNGYWADMKTKRVRAIKPEELKGEEMAYDVNRRRYAQKLEAHGRLAKPKGAQVTLRSGGKVGAGLALIGGGIALHRKRTEPRYD